MPDAFNDIVGGSNPGCGTEGFTVRVTVIRCMACRLYLLLQAEVGWDPVTGFGTPNFGKLLDIALGEWGNLIDF